VIVVSDCIRNTEASIIKWIAVMSKTLTGNFNVDRWNMMTQGRPPVPVKAMIQSQAAKLVDRPAVNIFVGLPQRFTGLKQAQHRNLEMWGDVAMITL